MARGDFTNRVPETFSAMDGGAGVPGVTLDSAVFADLGVKMTAILGHGSLSIRAIMGLADGSILDLDTPLDGLIDITINGRIIAQGEIVAVDDRFGVRIKNVVVENK